MLRLSSPLELARSSEVDERFVGPLLGFEDEPEGVWREPAWLVHGMDREEAISFGRVFRQNTIVVCRNGHPELVVTDPTCDDVGRTFLGNWRLRT